MRRELVCLAPFLITCALSTYEWISADYAYAEGPGGQAAPPALPPVMVPSDVTNQPMTGGRDPGSRAGRGAYGKPASTWINQPIAGIRQLPAGKFGAPASRCDAGLFLEQSHNAGVETINPCTVVLHSGQVIVSVSRPTKAAIIKTALADISVQAPGTALISAGADSLRVINLIGQGNRIRIKLSNDAPDSPVFAIDTSYEFVYSKGKLALADLHPSDSIGRRNLHLLENGKAAISQVSLYTVLNSNDLLAALARSGEDKEKHILASIAKMAAVISYVDGSGGYMSEPKNP